MGTSKEIDNESRSNALRLNVSVGRSASVGSGFLQNRAPHPA